MTLFSEAIKLKDSVFFNLDYHQDRVDNTLRVFGRTRIDLSVIKYMIPSGIKDGLFKCRVFYSDRIEKVEFLPYSFRHIQRVGVVMDDSISYPYKYADRSTINKLLHKSGCDDILIIKKGLITDASASNLVFRSSEGFFTPKDYLLSGTKRKYLLDCNTIKEMSIKANDIKKFDSIYFINAMIDLADDIKIDISSLIYL